MVLSSREEFIENNSLEDETVILEEWDVFKKGIIGISSDGCHIIYSYDELVVALADSYRDDAESDEDAEQMAIDWLEYNTLRSLDYIGPGYRPIICMQSIC